MEKKELQVHRHRAGGTINSSLYLARMQAGIPADMVVDMIHMFSYKVDFQRDLHPGDKFEVYYDYYYTPEGQPAKYGYDQLCHADSRRQADPNVPLPGRSQRAAEYFDAKGESAKGMLMKTPVDGARISSGFGSRFHPILGLYPHAQGRGLRGAHRHAGDGGGRWHTQIHGLGQWLWQFRGDQSRQQLCHRLWPSLALCAGHASGRAGAPGRRSLPIAA